MKILLFIVAIVFLHSCNRVNNKIAEEIAGADSVAINYFKGDGTMDTVVAVRIISDSIAVAQLSKFVAARGINTYRKCGYDGSIHFFKWNRIIRDIDFRMNDEKCMTFSFKQDGELKATLLSSEAKQFLESIKMKK